MTNTTGVCTAWRAVWAVRNGVHKFSVLLLIRQLVLLASQDQGLAALFYQFFVLSRKKGVGQL